MAGSRDWEREQRRVAAELERERRAAEREQLAAEKAARQARVLERKEHARLRTEEREERVTSLRSLLPYGLRSAAAIHVDGLRRRPVLVSLELGDLAQPIVATAWELAEPPRPGALSRAFGGMSRWREQRDAARNRYDAYVADVQRRERARQEDVERKQRERDEQNRHALEEARRHNLEIDRIRDGLPGREKYAVEAFRRHVLAGLRLPEGFPHEAEVAYSPATEQALVKLTLPPRDVVPMEKSFTYVERRTPSG